MPHPPRRANRRCGTRGEMNDFLTKLGIGEIHSGAWKQYMRRQSNTIHWGRELPLAQGIRFDAD